MKFQQQLRSRDYYVAMFTKDDEERARIFGVFAAIDKDIDPAHEDVALYQAYCSFVANKFRVEEWKRLRGIEAQK